MNSVLRIYFLIFYFHVYFHLYIIFILFAIHIQGIKLLDREKFCVCVFRSNSEDEIMSFKMR